MTKENFDFELFQKEEQPPPVKRRWMFSVFLLLIWAMFFIFFVVVTKMAHDHLHFQLTVSPQSQLDYFAQQLNRSFVPMHQLFGHTSGPLGVLANEIAQQMDNPLIAQVFVDHLSPRKLNATDQEMMRTLNAKIDVVFDFAQSQLLNLGTQAYMYLDTGQALIRKTIAFVFYGACTASVFLGLQFFLFWFHK
jgi:hypothetical protein